MRIVFVSAMWVTGFDVQPCSTIYLDKPMKNHTLMQTIARANRVFRDKQNGLIVDYVGVFRNLQKALAIYGAPLDGGQGGSVPGGMPAQDKGELVRQVREAISRTTAFCLEQKVDPARIRDARGFEREKLKEDAVAALVVNDETRRQYLNLAAGVGALFKSLLPDARAFEFSPMANVFKVVAEKIRSELPVVDISDRYSRRQHSTPTRVPRQWPTRELRRMPSLPAWTRYRPSNGRPPPARRRPE